MADSWQALVRSVFPPEDAVGLSRYNPVVQVRIDADGTWHTCFEWAGQDDASLPKGEVISCVPMCRRVIAMNGQDAGLDVAGIGFVCTAEAERGKGWFPLLMSLAHRAAMAWEMPWVLLSTSHDALYAPLGYRRAPNLPEEWMVCSLGPWTWPEKAQIDLKATW